MTTGREAQAPRLARPVWQRLRFWIGLAAIAVVGGILLAIFAPAPGRPLDPSSARKNGSKALATLLRHYGTAVVRTTSIDDAEGTVLVAAPNDYSSAQLREIADRADRVVLVSPDPEVISGLTPEISETEVADPARVPPGCSWAGARATGAVDFRQPVARYAGDGVSCYRGALFLTPRIVVLGSSALLRNDELARDGVAALDVNAISDNRTLSRVVWLLPGGDAQPSSGRSVWDLFPSGARRVAVWLIFVSVLLLLWRGRRLGPPVSEPLPLVVRAAEAVEGHGRLYRRAGARDRAAAALRAAAAAQLSTHYGLPKRASRADVAGTVAARTGRDAATVSRLLMDEPPADDAELIRLANQLDDLTAAARRPSDQVQRPHEQRGWQQ